MSFFLNPKDPSTVQSFSITLDHHVDSLTALSQWVETVGQTMQLSRALCFKLNLVLEEVVTNVIQHGSQIDDKNSHKNDDKTRDTNQDTNRDTSPITVSVHYEPHQIHLIVSDRGIPFNPLQDHNVQLPASLENAKIGGLGIHLITSYTHTINYERRGDRNILTMTFLRADDSVET